MDRVIEFIECNWEAFVESCEESGENPETILEELKRLGSI